MFSLTGIYYMFVMVMAEVSVIMSMLVISLSNSTIAMPKWVRKLQSNVVL